MSTCKHCRWWQRDHPDNLDDWQIFSPRDPDTFEKMHGMPQVRYCRSPKLVFGERPVESHWAALVDGSDYAAGLITGADFGCVNFEETVAQPPE